MEQVLAQPMKEPVPVAAAAVAGRAELQGRFVENSLLELVREVR